jgi:hypothetical protein
MLRPTDETQIKYMTKRPVNQSEQKVTLITKEFRISVMMYSISVQMQGIQRCSLKKDGEHWLQFYI